MNQRPIKKIRLHPNFLKRHKGLPEHKKELYRQKEFIFKQNAFDPRLGTHKLHGELKEFWAFNIDDSLRVVFIFVDEQTVGFINIGPHSIYK